MAFIFHFLSIFVFYKFCALVQHCKAQSWWVQSAVKSMRVNVWLCPLDPNAHSTYIDTKQACYTAVDGCTLPYVDVVLSVGFYVFITNMYVFYVPAHAAILQRFLVTLGRLGWVNERRILLSLFLRGITGARSKLKMKFRMSILFRIKHSFWWCCRRSCQIRGL